MPVGCLKLLKRLFLTTYDPEPDAQDFRARAQTQTSFDVDVTVAVPDARECERLFGVSLVRRGLQPIHLQIVNRSDMPLRLHFRSIDPHYYPPLEAAARCHFSIIKRLSTYGVFVWFYLSLLLLVLLILAPLKLITAGWCNQKMDAWFQSLGFHRRPIPPGGHSEGFVFASYDAGTKMVRVRLIATGRHQKSEPRLNDSLASEAHTTIAQLTSEEASGAFVDLTFSVSVAGINSDHLHRKLDNLIPPDQIRDCDLSSLIARLKEVSTVTRNHREEGSGDPINLVVIGDFETMLNAFAGRWDETEVISLASCWKTARAFLLGSEYRYSPVSALFLFGRSQDIALQQIRESISQRLHLRLWLSSMTFQKIPVWVGQVSRDIGVRFTTSAWNLTTHRIDSDVDEARDYVLEDLLDAEHVEAAGYVDASGPSSEQSPCRNLTGDPYFTDGKRVVILLNAQRTVPKFVIWS